jgi:hypothetical protein
MLKKYLVVVTTYFRLGENILSWGQHISGWKKISCPGHKIFSEAFSASARRKGARRLKIAPLGWVGLG